MNDRSNNCTACAPEPVRRARLRVPAMDCPTEEKIIRKKLAGFPGVQRLEFDLVGRTLALTHAADALEPARAALKQAGFDTELLAAAALEAEEGHEAVARSTWWRFGIAGAAALLE